MNLYEEYRCNLSLNVFSAEPSQLMGVNSTNTSAAHHSCMEMRTLDEGALSAILPTTKDSRSIIQHSFQRVALEGEDVYPFVRIKAESKEASEKLKNQIIDQIVNYISSKFSAAFITQERLSPQAQAPDCVLFRQDLHPGMADEEYCFGLTWEEGTQNRRARILLVRAKALEDDIGMEKLIYQVLVVQQLHRS